MCMSLLSKFSNQQNLTGTQQNERKGGKTLPAVPVLQKASKRYGQPAKKENNTGLPDSLKHGVESLSGYSMDDVKVNYNSAQPAQLNALAFASGTDIHLGPGQEKHLPHEAWHVVQQKQGRVQPTIQMKNNVPVNDDPGLEKEADIMGEHAFSEQAVIQEKTTGSGSVTRPVAQLMTTKEDLLIEQIKYQLSTALYMAAGKSDAKQETQEKYKELLKEFVSVGIVPSILKFKGKTVSEFYKAERETGFKDVTLTKLQDKKILLSAIKSNLNSSWEALTTTIGDDSEATGSGGFMDEAKTRKVKTKVKWKEVNTNIKEGEKMEALILGPDHRLGTGPTDATRDKSNSFAKYSSEKYIAGHLLNDHLGGPGNDSRNIAAIPGDINSNQSVQVEEKVKDLVNNQHKIVYYSVEVQYDKDKKLNDHYASRITSVFGVYKEDTDFSKLTFGNFPAADLTAKYDHVLSIDSPTEYKKYIVDNPTKEPVMSGVKANTVNAKILLNFHHDVILGDAKQLKLDFISYAIASLELRKLQDEIEKLKRNSQVEIKKLKQSTEEEIEKLTKVSQEKSKILTDQLDIEKNLVKESEIKIKEVGRAFQLQIEKLRKSSAEEIEKLTIQLKTDKILLLGLTSDFEELQKSLQKEMAEKIDLQGENKTTLKEKRDLEDKIKKSAMDLESAKYDISKIEEKLQDEQMQKREFAGELGKSNALAGIQTSISMTPKSKDMYKSRYEQTSEKIQSDLPEAKTRASEAGRDSAMGLLFKHYYGSPQDKMEETLITAWSSFTSLHKEKVLDDYKQGFIEGYQEQLEMGKEQFNNHTELGHINGEKAGREDFYAKKSKDHSRHKLRDKKYVAYNESFEKAYNEAYDKADDDTNY